MADKNPNSAEQQLLNLIEKPKAGEVKKASAKHKRRSALSFGGMRGRLSFFKNMFSGGLTAKRPPMDLKSVNKVLSIGILFFSMYVGVTLTMTAMDLSKVPEFSPEKTQGAPFGLDNAAPKLSALKYYLEKPTARNIFDFKELLEPETEIARDVIVEEDTVRAIDKELMSFRLAGIAWSDNPDAMIENLATKEMYFLKKGGLIDGKILIEGIFRNKVNVSYKGQEAELQ
ncbi:MAG: hypothetical protein ABIJ27_07610 [Candidatus Omnitrophota bacterium]